MLITIGTHQVDVLDTRCPNRSCYIFGFDKGTFVRGRGYTNYWSTPKPVCWRRHLSGCPVTGVCSVCRTAAVEGMRTCERLDGPDPFHLTPCGGTIIPAGSQGQ